MSSKVLKPIKNRWIGVITSFLIYAFLSGVIIDIPKGTHEGGVIGAVGVGVILVCMFIIIFIKNKITNFKK